MAPSQLACGRVGMVLGHSLACVWPCWDVLGHGGSLVAQVSPLPWPGQSHVPPRAKSALEEEALWAAQTEEWVEETAPAQAKSALEEALWAAQTEEWVEETAPGDGGSAADLAPSSADSGLIFYEDHFGPKTCRRCGRETSSAGPECAHHASTPSARRQPGAEGTREASGGVCAPPEGYEVLHSLLQEISDGSEGRLIDSTSSTASSVIPSSAECVVRLLDDGPVRVRENFFTYRPGEHGSQAR